MNTEKLSHEECLEFDPEGGSIGFAGARALLLDAVALGILRKHLVEDSGTTAARKLLNQFGFAQGWQLADAAQSLRSRKTQEDWHGAGLELMQLQGLFSQAPGSKSPLSEEGALLESSFESEQQLLHFGVGESPVCWTLCGLMSGYLSYSTGKEVIVREDRCQGRGDPACHMLGRTSSEWAEEGTEEPGFLDAKSEIECMNVSRQRVTQTLKTVEGKLEKRVRKPVQFTPEIEPGTGIVAKSQEMQQAITMARRVAKVDVTVVITGESGSGKERVAHLLHDESHRAAGPFVAVNCAAIAESLLESELFGHARGSFSGAIRDRPGLFEAARGGTLFLDEVGELPLGPQTKLLRVIQEREVRRVGENKSRSIDVRIVAATNVNLEDSVRSSAFRRDLYYRLKVVTIHVPTLRERRDDILPLAQLMLLEASRRMGRATKNISDDAAYRLRLYPWPGNARELENAMERAMALCEGVRIELSDLPEEVRSTLSPSQDQTENKRALHEIERDHILASLRQNDGNQSRTAKELEIGSATLYRKLKSYRAGPSEPGAGDS